MEDEYVCEYDSTWDTESDGDDPAGENQIRRSNSDKNKSSWALWHHTPRNLRAAKDMQNYRRGYPNLTDDECSEDKMNNLQFYLNKYPSAPDDIYIESFLKEWKNDYKRLERVHSYIQWLFPLREPGVNYMASELTKKEIEAFKENKDAKRRLMESYELMLGFYGIRLVNKETGEVKRADNWKERFGNLERNMHNNLRITRILKSLGELGFRHYQPPLVHFFLEETLVKKTLSSVKRSVLDYFLFAVLDKKERQKLVRFAYLHFEPKEKFVWCPRKIQKQFRRSAKNSEAGEEKDEACLFVKNFGDAAVQQKDDGSDSIAKAPKGSDKSKEKSKQPEESPETQSAETVGNGNVGTESNTNCLSNGSDSTDDALEMSESLASDTEATEKAKRQQPKTNSEHNSEDAVQEAESPQSDGDLETEKPPKKKREDDEVTPKSSAPTEDSACGQMEGKAVAEEPPGTASPSAHTPLKTSKHSPSPSSGREGKIPRTDFCPAPEQVDDAAARKNALITNETKTSKAAAPQRNGTSSEDVNMDLNVPNST